MPYTMEDFERDFTEEHLHLLSPETIFRRFSPETIFSQFSPEERLKRLPPEIIEMYLSKLKKKD